MPFFPLLSNRHVGLAFGGPSAEPAATSMRAGVNEVINHCAVSLDVVFLVDVSGSLEQYGYDIHLSLIKTIVQGLNFQYERTRIAYVTFAQKSTIRFNFGQYLTAADVINAVTIDGVEQGTNIAGALRAVRTQIFGDPTVEYRPQAARLCLLLSDFQANIEQGNIIEEADLLKNLDGGVTIFAAGIGEAVDEVIMSEVVSDPGTIYSDLIETRDDVAQHAEIILNTICQL